MHVSPAAGAEGVGRIGVDFEGGGLLWPLPFFFGYGPCRSRIYRGLHIAAQNTEYVCRRSGATVSRCRARRVLPSLEDFGKFGERPDRAANVCGGCGRGGEAVEMVEMMAGKWGWKTAWKSEW